VLRDLSNVELIDLCRDTRLECDEYVVARRELESEHECVQDRIARLLAGKGMR